MSHNSRYSITNPNVVHETIDGETIILKLDTGVYYSLNDFGGKVWSLIGRGLGVDEIVDSCLSEFDGLPEQIEGTARRLLGDLERDDLIVLETDSDGHEERAILKGQVGLEKSSRPALRLPVIRKYEDMQDLLLIDPFHDVPEEGWPERKQAAVPSISSSGQTSG